MKAEKKQICHEAVVNYFRVEFFELRYHES